MSDKTSNNTQELNSNAFKILNNRLMKPTSSVSKSEKINPILAAQKSSSLYNSSTTFASSLTKEKIEAPKTLGKGWFGLEPMKLDDNVKRDIRMIQMRNYIDPKRFYKNPDKLGQVLHIGTVIEGPSEYKSQRLTNKERKQSIMEEILADKDIKNYTKKKFGEIQESKSGKNKRKAYKAEKKSFKKQQRSAMY